MNKREKILALGVGGIVLVFAASFGGRAFFAKPLREIDTKTQALREKLSTINKEKSAYLTNETTVKTYAQQTFSDEVDQASAKSGEILTQQLILSGLQEADFSRMPVGPRKLRGASEIGWGVQGDGKLENVINLLFLLQRSPYLHRLDNLVLSPGDDPGEVRVRFRYLSLVFDPAPKVEPTELSSKFTSESPERRTFDSIVARDLLRPYVKRMPTSAPGHKSAPASPPQPAGPEGLRIVSLSDWMGQPEVHVRDTRRDKTLRYRPGDILAGGTIEMVDYRPLPMPDRPTLKSFSRVIVKIQSDYWAIEHGSTLMEKYKLLPTQLPEVLARRSSSASTK